MIEILRVTAAFGIKGAVRVVLFSNNIKKYKKLYDQNGNAYDFRILNQKNDTAVLMLSSISDRTSAEKLKGAFFFIKREDMQILDEDKFYVCDLIGMNLKVLKSSELELKIIDVKNFGAGDLIEISEGKSSFYVPFTKENFPEEEGELFLSKKAYEDFKN